MAKISYIIFDNSSYPVYYGVDSDKKGIEVKDKPKPTSVEVTGNKKLYIWAAEKNEGLPKDCCIKFPTHVIEGGKEYKVDDFEINLTFNRSTKQFILSGEPGPRKDIKVLVSVRDKSSRTEIS